MFNILVVDSGAIDRDMTREVLLGNLNGPAEVYGAVGTKEACAILEEQRIDLLIADVPQTTAYVKNLVRTARSLQGGIKVLLTSVKSGGEIARLANQLGAVGYLLKPFRRETLVEKVRPMEESARAARARAGEEEQQACLNSIANSIQDCQYKKSIETAKEYIDFLYQSGDNVSAIRMKMVEFATGLADLGQFQSQASRRRLDACLERFRTRFDLQSNRFEATSVMEEMLDIIFAELERNQLYSDDDLKKVLNYIDRNIKKGITLDAAAEYVNMSSSYFSKFFKKSTGINFITYVTDRKIEFAKDMLENTDMPVINIAYELSYNETNYFSKAFKKKVGVTPTEYREQCLQRPKMMTRTQMMEEIVKGAINCE